MFHCVAFVIHGMEPIFHAMELMLRKACLESGDNHACRGRFWVCVGISTARNGHALGQ